MPEAIVALGKAKRIVGRLRFESSGRRQHSQFEYDSAWLAAPDAFALAPDLPLAPGSYYTAGGRDDMRSALHGCFADAAPDSWGRGLMRKALGGGLTEFDYLTRSDDQTRQGALRFLSETLDPLSDLSPPVPRRVELSRLREVAARFERDPEAAEEEARELAGAGASLGGARPKANVEDETGLWIAKFTSIRDTRPIERVEVATLNLATACGLNAAKAQLELKNTQTPIALIKRFDRHGDGRIPYMSARTALGWTQAEGAYYTDIADIIRQISGDPLADLLELWMRIVFTILVSNTDDHLKNHGFIYVGGNRWRLSPAFDINPSPDRHKVLETGILRDEGFEASLDLALKAAPVFGLSASDAARIAKNMAQTVQREWKQACKDQGMTSAEINAYAPAFEHSATLQALQL